MIFHEIRDFGNIGTTGPPYYSVIGAVPVKEENLNILWRILPVQPVKVRKAPRIKIRPMIFINILVPPSVPKCCSAQSIGPVKL